MAGIESYVSALGKLNEIPKSTTGSSGTVSKLPYTGGTPVVSKLPYTGGTPTVSKLNNGTSGGGVSGGAPYTLGTQAGKNAYDYVKSTGVDTTLTDGTVLSSDAGGNVVAKRPGGGVLSTSVTYQPDTTDSDAMAAALMGLYSGQNNAYAKAQAQQEAATNAAVQKAVGDLQQQKKNTDLSYSQLFRQLYLNRMNAEKNLEQQMAAQGINGGASESSRLGLSTSYAEALRQGEQERLNTQSDLDKAITDTRLTGDISIAESAAENAINSANSYASVLQSLLNRNDTLEQNALNRQDALDAILREENEAKKTNAYKLAMAVLGGGEMPDDATLAVAGIPKETATILQKIYKPQKTYTESQALYAAYAALGGDTSDSVRAIVESYYGMPLESVLLALRIAGAV